ncbi:MFS transporter [Fodinibius sediminis]|uniref:MFS transporter, UMF1 family n=1 Tax=Fodinibius sediminis TaxID=1214077 RepID=A0A521BWI7_9BACT|nr:MFS transporter [Fodinibius sediminis]SMO51549.1 MFS transporter, UMF1 family [Fodinibius sediminis]
MNNKEKTSAAALVSWALYDWANSAFFAVIQTFVFATYFMQSVAENDTLGSTQWGNTIGAAGLVVAVCAPFVGAVADQMGRRKPWIGWFTLLSVTATAGLWFIEPSQQFVLMALMLVFLGTIGSEFAIIFYNAMLPDLASDERMGRWSGWSWGLGYAGGLACLVIALLVFVDVETPPFGLDKEAAEHIRATFVLVAAWYTLFSVPLFGVTPDRPQTGTGLGEAVKSGWKQLKTSVQEVRKYRFIVRFLVARMIFIDALATVFAFGGIYAAGAFDFGERDVLLFGIGLNLTAGLGAAAFAWLDDKLGSRLTMLVSLVGLVICTSAVLLVYMELLFWLFGLLLGIFVGPVQAASRTYMAHVAPPDLQNQMFGLMALSGKVTAFMGPLLVGWLTFYTDSQRIGMSVIVVLFVLGFILLYQLPDAKEVREQSFSADS